MFNAAVSLNAKHLKENWAEMLRLLICAAFPMWLATSLCVYIIFRYDVLFCLAVGGCLAPTDPVLSSTVVKGKSSPPALHTGGRLMLPF